MPSPLTAQTESTQSTFPIPEAALYMHVMETWSSRRNALLGGHQQLYPFPWNHQAKAAPDELNISPGLCPAKWSPAGGGKCSAPPSTVPSKPSVLELPQTCSWWDSARELLLNTCGPPELNISHPYRQQTKRQGWFELETQQRQCCTSLLPADSAYSPGFCLRFIFPADVCKPLPLERVLTESKCSSCMLQWKQGKQIKN